MYAVENITDRTINDCLNAINCKYSKYIDCTDYNKNTLVSLKAYLTKHPNKNISYDKIIVLIEKLFIKEINKDLNNNLNAKKIINDILNRQFSISTSNQKMIIYIKEIDSFFKSLNYNPVIDLLVEIIRINNNLQNFLKYVVNEKSAITESNSLLSSLIDGYNLVNDIQVDNLDVKYSDDNLTDNSSILKMYLKDIRHKLLTKEEEINLAIKAKQGDRKARHELIESNLLLVVSIARKYCYPGCELLDLISEGNIGLMKAVDKYDPSKGFRFSTYAIWWIKNYILQSINNNINLIRISEYQNIVLSKYENIKNDLSRELDREPTIDEVSNEIGISKEKLVYLLNVSKTPLSLSMAVSDEIDFTLEEMIPNNEISVVDSVINREFKSEVLRILSSKLTQKEFTVIALRTGLIDGNKWKLKDIGNRYNLSRERIRQIENKVIRLLSHDEELIKIYKK